MDEFEKYMEEERIRRGYVDSFVSPHEAETYPAKFRRLHT